MSQDTPGGAAILGPQEQQQLLQALQSLQPHDGALTSMPCHHGAPFQEILAKSNLAINRGQAPLLRLYQAQTLQVIMMGHSKARVKRQVLQKVALLQVASVQPAVKYQMAKSIWPAPANSAGRKRSKQERGNCRLKTLARKKHFPSRKAWNR